MNKEALKRTIIDTIYVLLIGIAHLLIVLTYKIHVALPGLLILTAMGSGMSYLTYINHKENIKREERDKK